MELTVYTSYARCLSFVSMNFHNSPNGMFYKLIYRKMSPDGSKTELK